MELTTLCYMEQEDAYLMLHRVKKKQDINKDKWIGIGGHFEEEESPEECLLREVKEETGLTLEEYSFCGMITFVCDHKITEYMHLFRGTKWSGTMMPCEEGELVWVKKKDLLTKNLWEGDFIFLALMEEQVPFFSLKLNYEQGQLTQAVLNGKDCLYATDTGRYNWKERYKDSIIKRSCMKKNDF